MGNWIPPRESVGIQQSHENTCFTCGRYVAPNEGRIEHEFDSVICPNCVKHTTRGDYRQSTGRNPDGSMKFKWQKTVTKLKQLDEDPESYHIGRDLGYGA